MRVLIVSASPLKKEISSGGTFLNLFDGMPDVVCASICTRWGKPDPQVSRCFCITETMLIKNFLKKAPAGMVLDEAAVQSEKTTDTMQKNMLDFGRRHRWTVFFLLQNLLWSIGNWKSKQLQQFVADFQPDVIFTVLSSSIFLNNLILYVVALSNAKLVLYAWDNNYTLKLFMLSPLRWIKHFVERASMRKVVQKADLLYVISEIQKRDYEACFRRHCSVLTKGADFSEQPERKERYNEPIQLVYTGNIGLNRWKSLKIIADALESINRNGVKAQLRIYTATPLSKKMEKALIRGESSCVMGSVPAQDVPKIQRDADILVHVEAFDLKNRLLVRQSFSTKIVDYLKASRPILAVGPKDVASIEHLIRNNCAIVADNKEELEQKLRSVLSEPAELSRIAENAYVCGRKHHNKQDIQTMLLRNLETICGV